MNAFLSPGVVNTVSTSSPQGSQGSGRGASHGMAGPLRLAALRGPVINKDPVEAAASGWRDRWGQIADGWWARHHALPDAV